MKARERATSAPSRSGLVIGSFGRHVLIEEPDGAQRICHPKGKKSEAVVGDQVTWEPSEDEGRIVAVQTRRNLLFRQDEMRTKSFAANLDQVCVFLGATPEFSERQLTRALIACEAAHIPALIVLNKHDLRAEFESAWARLAPYREAGYAMLALSLTPGAEHGVTDLETRLHNRATLVLGPSGAGKSSLINRLLPHARVLTQQISQALNSGKHTTTSTTWYWTSESKSGAIIDSPGFQEFGLQHVEAGQLAALMPDIARHTGGCKYYNCTHRVEPGCSVRAALAEGHSASEAPHINAGRYRMFLELYEELSQPPRY
jgi:ribosome biogenesis GTPase / thiamine phosphate phosphatase